MFYYKAELLCMITEYNKESQDWSGWTYDNGIIETYEASKLTDLMNKIQKVYDLTSWELVEDEPNRLETNFIDDESNNLVDYSLYFTRVQTTDLDIQHIFKKKAV